MEEYGMEIDGKIENIGWTLGNDCPYRCKQCYSNIVRTKGRNLTKKDINRIIQQIASIGIKTVNLGGNEPLFTNGIDPKNTLLPYIIRSLYSAGIAVGLTTAGITLTYLEQFYPDTLSFLNDIDISLDSPFCDEHNKNRGAKLYGIALKALDICNEYEITHTIITCGMDWNLSNRHIDGLVKLAREYRSFVRINFLKPTEASHMERFPNAYVYYSATQRLLSQCRIVDMSEPLISVATHHTGMGCPCGNKSFRIHSITPDGKVPISPCVYAHDYKVGDLLTEELTDILNSRQFQIFKNRCQNPQNINGCRDCQNIESCRGGCASRAYLVNKFKTNTVDLFVRDPYCIKEIQEMNNTKPLLNVAEFSDDKSMTFVHRNYLCTMILEPR